MMTAARRRPIPPPPPPARASIRQVGRPTYEVELDDRTVFDFLVGLLHDMDDLSELQPADRRWLTDARKGLGPDQRDLLGLEHAKTGPPNVMALLIDRPEIADGRSFVEAVRTADPADIVRGIFADLAEEQGVGDRLDGALTRDAAALRAVRKVLDERVVSAISEPARWVGRLQGVLEYWLERFNEVEDRIAAWADRDVASRQGDLRRMSPADFVERATGGIRFLADSEVRRVILAPSYFARPFNYVFAADGWRLFCYPIADDAIGGLDPIAPPPAAVRLYRALGDETRLRILRLLAERDHYLTELAQHLELSKPTIKHHLAQLRAAGLVTLTEEGSLTYYSLRRDRIAEAGDDVVRYLAR
jgi:DNA-binding transcriptional ArsR family regulator